MQQLCREASTCGIRGGPLVRHAVGLGASLTGTDADRKPSVPCGAPDPVPIGPGAVVMRDQAGEPKPR